MDDVLHLGMIQQESINRTGFASGKTLQKIPDIKATDTLFLASINASEKMYLSILGEQVNDIFIETLVNVVPICVLQVSNGLGIF
jgi:hypothetical protein